ncbi:P-loop containing nucleoside triphosphate hydrolase protein [Lipomyces arxii]|uniref:P-loop containing nucleoside triphosphate hydrolase protein n=1 Tax=Lipomyces arxii TaxID=56418 RepID=UPI0034CD5D6B
MSYAPSRESSNSIKVVARFRPLNAAEAQVGGGVIVKFAGNDSCNLDTRDFDGSFTFDRVFPMNSTQSEVFDFSIKSTVDDIINGYNGTVFAYGQTGSGKSYTMMGPSIADADRGIIPRIVEQIFASIMRSPPNIEYTVRVSYMEIYMERIKDLLKSELDNLPIHEEKGKGVYVKGLSEIYVSSVEEVYNVMRKGSAARAVSSTSMNMESSRSHSIFAVVVSQKNLETGSAKSGQLFLVDLAGSEKVGKTGASGLVLEEAKKINKSLSALGMVINALTDGKSSHIPYRDSKLTRILQESLGGNSRTTLIVNCSPSAYNDQETISTLRFGTRAKNIKNKPMINTELSPAELKAQLKKAVVKNTEYSQYILSLEQELALWRSGESVPKDRWFSMGNPVKHFSSGSSSPLADASKQTWDPDEREEYLQRENDLQDKLSDRETVILGLERLVSESKKETSTLRLKEAETDKLTETLENEIFSLKASIEKLQFEAKDNAVMVESLKELNAEMTSELDSLRSQLHETAIQAEKQTFKIEERNRRKREKLRQIISGFEYFAIGGDSRLTDSDDGILPDNDATKREDDSSSKTDWIGSALTMLDSLNGTGSLDDSSTTSLKVCLMEARQFISRTEQVLDNRIEEVEMQLERREEIESLLGEMKAKLTSVVQESSDNSQGYDEYLKSKQALLEGLLVESKQNLRLVLNDNKRLRKIADVNAVSNMPASVRPLSASSSVTSSTSSVSSCNNPSIAVLDSPAVSAGHIAAQSQATSVSTPSSPSKDRTGKNIQSTMADFKIAKKSLMRDLQSRCERVVELEILLDEMREQYKSLVKTTNSGRVQQKRMAILERNLDQLTQVQRSLVDQNVQLKRDLAMTEVKLAARNERIAGLESLLQDSQERLVAETQGYETRLGALRNRLEDVKVFRKQADGNRSPDIAGIALQTQRIVKPLRGGGGVLSFGSSPLSGHPKSTVENKTDASNTSPTSSKRSSWFSRA